MAASAPRLPLLVALVVLLAGWGWLATDHRRVAAGVRELVHPLVGGRATTALARGDLRFGPGVSASDRAGVQAALARARPEARALVAAVDGLVEVRTHRGGNVGFTRYGRDLVVVSVDLEAVRAEGPRGRDFVVLHEIGHVLDHVLVSPRLDVVLDRTIPRSGDCGERRVRGACAEREERFADTFAKWALRDLADDLPIGYAVGVPFSLEAWGGPLGELAAEQT